MLVLTRADVANVLDIADVIDIVERAHEAVALGNATEGNRLALPLPNSDALLIPMSAGIGTLSASGLKLLTDSPANPAHGRPRQQSVILLLDEQTNAVEALIDGAEITMLRTAAASAVATKYLSRPDSSTLGLIGAGALARTHLAAIRSVRPIRSVMVWSRNRETADRFVADTAETGLDVVVMPSVDDVVDRADILCTLTPARTPILSGAALRPGTHVNVVGAPPRPEYREIDTEVIRRSRVIVDSRAVAASESGAIQLAIEQGVLDLVDVPELGQVVAGQLDGRTSQDQITLYSSVGLGIQDMATARLLVSIARQKGLGTEIPLTVSPAALSVTV